MKLPTIGVNTMDVMAMQIAQILVALLLQQEHSATQTARRTAPQRSQKNAKRGCDNTGRDSANTEIILYMRYEDEGLYGEIEQNKESEGDDSEGELRR
jgi:hypothetical protein